MRTGLFPKFIELYEIYKNSNDYTSRKAQFDVVALNKKIIEKTLQNTPVGNENLTGLIQMFKYGCSNKTFDKYLQLNISDPTQLVELSSLADKVDIWGYTGAGLNAITGLDSQQLRNICDFLKKAFSINTIEKAVKLCVDFDNLGIPIVKSGIYSPWLYYINPEVFPILNNSHTKFREWIGIASDYPTCIKAFNELKVLVEEVDLGLVDMFTHSFDKYINGSSELATLDIKSNKLYKISHGIFKKEKNFLKTEFASVLEQKKWICLFSGTGKNQGNNFANKLQKGDYLYICYGGDDLYCIAKVISNSKPLDPDSDELISGNNQWIYREIEPLFYPINYSVREFKKDQRFFMPSGNSTFYEVPKGQIEFMNTNIFQPKYNVKIISGVNNITSSESQIADNQNNNNIKFNMPLNTILFGPPGTGKTYSTIDLALEILNISIENISRKQRKIDFVNSQNDTRVFFTTFHQNMAYEDFIEGIKPIEPKDDDEFLKYEIQDGLFMKACIEATYNFISKNFPENEQEIQIRTFNQLYDQLFDQIEQSGESALQTLNGGQVLVSVTDQGNFSVKHVNGSRTYTVSRNRLAPLFERFPDLEEIKNIHKEFRSIIGGCNSTAFWSILNEIYNLQPNQEPANQEIIDLEYEDKKSIVKSYWKTALYQLIEVDKSEPYVFIIDEINRGNVAQIFGELITLIEEDKRLGKAEQIRLELPYSKTPFAVPPNLYIIGTMNTADRSVEALDAALRRRFCFEEMPPLYNLEGLQNDIFGHKAFAILEKINLRIEKLLDKDHKIGHSYLLNKDENSIIDSFYKNIIPLLQEYFFGDYSKIGLVLGEGFVNLKQSGTESNIFAKFYDVDNDFTERYIYEIIDYRDKPDEVMNFGQAIQDLMNK